MAINIEGTQHVDLNLVGKNKESYAIFPSNTSDDVLVDEDGNILSDALPTINNSTAKSGFLEVAEVDGEEEITNETLIARLTTDDDEDFSDVEPSEDEPEGEEDEEEKEEP